MIQEKIEQLIKKSKKVERKEFKKYPGKASTIYNIEVGKQLAYNKVLSLIHDSHNK